MHPDRNGRALFQSAPLEPAPPRAAHVDYLLTFVIERSVTREEGVAARIDSLERTLAALTRTWRDDARLSPVRELRASDETLRTLLAWLERGGDLDRGAIERLGVYASGAITDREVPAGWLRVRLA